MYLIYFWEHGQKIIQVIHLKHILLLIFQTDLKKKKKKKKFTQSCSDFNLRN